MIMASHFRKFVWLVILVPFILLGIVIINKIVSYNNICYKYNNSHTSSFSRKNINNILNIKQDRNGFIRNCITGEQEQVDVIGFYDKQKPIELIVEGIGEFENGHERREAFSKIFKERTWKPNNDKAAIHASGPSSTLYFVQEAICLLHLIVSKIKESTGRDRVSILDLPCGDMLWMSRFLQTRGDIDYTGLDIVPAIIQHHREKYINSTWKFDVFDVVESPINSSYDLIICRIALPHLPLWDIVKVLKHFSDSGSTYLLTTTYPQFQNSPLYSLKVGGRFRPINLESPPISLTRPICIMKDGPYGVHDDPFLGLWKLPLSQKFNITDNERNDEQPADGLW